MKRRSLWLLHLGSSSDAFLLAQDPSEPYSAGAGERSTPQRRPELPPLGSGNHGSVPCRKRVCALGESGFHHPSRQDQIDQSRT